MTKKKEWAPEKGELAMIEGIIEGSPEAIGVAVIRLDCNCRTPPPTATFSTSTSPRETEDDSTALGPCAENSLPTHRPRQPCLPVGSAHHGILPHPGKRDIDTP